MIESPHISEIVHPKNVHHLIDGHIQSQHKQNENSDVNFFQFFLFSRLTLGKASIPIKETFYVTMRSNYVNRKVGSAPLIMLWRL